MKRACSDNMAQLSLMPPPFQQNHDNGGLQGAYGITQLQPMPAKRPCYNPAEPQQQLSGQNPGTSDVYSHFDVYNTASGYPPRRATPFSMPQQLPQQLYQAHGGNTYMQPAHLVPAGSDMRNGPTDHLMAMQQGNMHQQQQPDLQASQHPVYNSTTGRTSSLAAAPGALLSQVQAQAAMHRPQPPQQLQQQQHIQQAPQPQQQQQQPALRLAGDWRPMTMTELQKLLPRLNQEYKREMQLLLKACQVAGRVTKQNLPPAPAAGMLLLDPAAREQLQHQVLSNCNDKHTAVIAAFRVAAQAVAAASSSLAANGGPSARAAAAAVEVLGGSSSGGRGMQGNLAALAEAAGKLDGADGDAAPEAVSEALQQLRSSYHQELVAATSALFAICRGFGQTSTMAAAASQPIKQALAAAQQQHVRVEQLWQDMLLVAAGGRD